jgi:putative CocE/NonD family hydrolase
MSTWITSAEFRNTIYPGDALHLEGLLGWTDLMLHQENIRFGLLGQMLRSTKKVEAAYWHLPLNQADRAATGKNVPFWQEWMIHDRPGDEWWADCDFSLDVPNVTAPNLMIGGWYDLFLPQTFRDYQALRQAGRNPYLTIGPWAHTDQKLLAVALGETVTWLRAHLLPGQDGLRELPVRLYVMGADEWRDYPAWPPTGYTPQSWYLQPDGRLAPSTPPESEPDLYRYDPANPTPSVGGAGLGQAKLMGAKDNRAVEARPDVLVYTSDVLEQDLEVIGPVTAVLYVHSSLPHTDFFARLCDVDPSGKSVNLCDGLIRLFPGKVVADSEGCMKVVIELWPTANLFKRGHRVRLQVSSGAFPRWARNTGSGEPTGTAITLKVAEQSVYHDPSRPSAVILSTKMRSKK